MQEREAEQEPALRELQEERFSLVKLTEFRGYQWLMDVAQQQIKTRTVAILQPLETDDRAYAQEFMKGEVAGIGLFVQLVDIQIRVLQEEIERRLAEGEKADEPEHD